MLQQTFLEFISGRDLRLPRCRQTGTFVDLALRAIPDGQVEWVKASGEATLYSFVVYRRQYHPDFPVPYNVAMVELREGPRLVSTVLIEDLSRLEIGMPLEATFDTGGRLVFLPAVRFREQRKS